jgi:hypothetical protein
VQNTVTWTDTSNPCPGRKPNDDDDDNNNIINNNNNNNNSILYYLCAEPTATKPITDTAQCT